jgi:hypothetical protein
MIDMPIIASTDRSLLKSKILAAGIAQQRKVMEDFRKRINEIMASEASESEEYDAHQQSFRSETMAEVSLLSDQLNLVNHELDQLMHIQPYYEEDHLCAEYGTVVKTDKETFFISSGIERFYAEETPVFGLSVHSPLYKVMKGKKVGDAFSYAGITHRIEEIF